MPKQQTLRGRRDGGLSPITQSIVTSQSSPYRVGLNIGVQTLLSDYIGRRHALALGMTLALIVPLAALFWAGSA